MDDLVGFQELEPNTVVADLVSYLEEQLPDFPDSSEFLNILSKKKNENQHSLSFCVFMTNRSNQRYYFGRENAQKGSSVIDIGVYLGSVLIFTIEAKILPIPLISSTRFEHEYIYGNGAGIQRFKDGNHGVDNEDNLLAENGLIAYIKENDFQYWLDKSNAWITEANWESSEYLQPNYFDKIGKLKSTHERKDKSAVTLHHFWVNVISTLS
jgi:hypothetical protein